jgi:outer membrane immunogenic protein
MRTKIKIARPVAAAFGLVALLGVIPANAADVVMDAPPAAPMAEPPLNTWTGPYAGVTLGYGFSGDVDEPGNSVGTDGVVAGVFGGYNYQMNNGIVAGVEADVGYNGMNGDEGGTRVKGGAEGSLRARLGYAVTPDILVYGTAGGAAQSVKLEEAGDSDRNTMLGWTAGVGTDVAVTDQVFGRVEYRYTDFGSQDFSLNGNSRDVDASNHRIQFGVGMKF